MKVKSRLTRCAMLAVSPVRRLSIPMTAYPRSSSVSARCDPMNPAAPVITTRCLLMSVDCLIGARSEWRRTVDRSRRFCDWRLSTGRLIRVFVEEPFHEGQPHDLQIETDRPVLDV